MKRPRSHWRFVLGGLILSLVWASPIGAQEQPILRFEGRVTYVAPSDMLVALDSAGGVTQLGANSGLLLGADPLVFLAQLAEIALQPAQGALDGVEIGLAGRLGEVADGDELGGGGRLRVLEDLQIARTRAHREAVGGGT